MTKREAKIVALQILSGNRMIIRSELPDYKFSPDEDDKVSAAMEEIFDAMERRWKKLEKQSK